MNRRITPDVSPMPQVESRLKGAVHNLGKFIAGVSVIVLGVDAFAAYVDKSNTLDAVGVVSMFTAVGGSALALLSWNKSEQVSVNVNDMPLAISDASAITDEALTNFITGM